LLAPIAFAIPFTITLTIARAACRRLRREQLAPRPLPRRIHVGRAHCDHSVIHPGITPSP
jgi:hypothetical protein